MRKLCCEVSRFFFFLSFVFLAFFVPFLISVRTKVLFFKGFFLLFSLLQLAVLERRYHRGELPDCDLWIFFFRFFLMGTIYKKNCCYWNFFFCCLSINLMLKKISYLFYWINSVKILDVKGFYSWIFFYF